MRKPKAVILILVASAFVFTFGCAKQPKEIRIGAMLPLTGDAATIGEPTRNAVELAVREYESRFVDKGYNLVLKAEDTQVKPSTGVSALNKLITVDKVRFTVGPMASSVALAVLPLANKNQVICVSPSASSPALSADDYFFRVELSEIQGAEKQAKLATQELGYRKIACLYVNNDYGRGTFEVFSESFREDGGRIVLESAFDEGTTDFRSMLTKIKHQDDKPDAVFIVFNTEIVNILTQMKELGLKIQVYTTPVFENESTLSELGSLAEGVIYTYYGQFDPKAKKRETEEFIAKYKGVYDQDPGYYAALGYDAAHVLLDALLSALPDLSADRVKQALMKTRYEGVTGPIEFDRNGDPEKPVTLKTVESGKFVIYSK